MSAMHDPDPKAPAPDRPGVLITGASGYLGRMVVARLAADPALHPIIATDLRPPDAPVPGVIYRAADIRRRDEVDRLIGERPLATVVHLAAVVTPPRGGDRELAWQVDVQGTRHVLDACVAHRVPKIIVTSSGAAYGYHADSPATLDEGAPLRGNEAFAYSHHKRVVEQLLASYRERHPELAQLVLRVGTVLGRGTHNQITALFERPFVLGLSGASSPFVFVWDEDVVSCIERGVREADRVGTFNLAGDGAMTLAEIARALGKPLVTLPPGVVRAALGVLARLGLAPYGPEQVMFLQHRPVLDSRRLRERFGFTPRSSREAFEIYRRARHA